METLTAADINCHIAKIDGWHEIGLMGDGYGVSPHLWEQGISSIVQHIPDYADSLELLHWVEKRLGLHDRNNLALRVKWVGILRDLVASTCPVNKVGSPIVSDIDLLLADSAVRAEALVILTRKKAKIK